MQAIQSYLPPEWGPAVQVLGAPLWWIPTWQQFVVNWGLFGDSLAGDVVRRVFLLLPVLLAVVGVWVTMAALYTIPFRSERGRFVTTLAMSWWDAGRSIWFFWSGIARLGLMVVGWLWGLLRTAVRMLVQIVKSLAQSPFAVLDWTSRRYFKPGVPWLAFLLTLGWSALEATIFTYTLLPTLLDVLANITGFEPNRAIVAPILWMLLFLLIAGSFACLEVLTQAVKARNAGRIAQMLFVEFFVLFFEVVFLYRELVDAITPWIAQQTGGEVRLGLVTTLLLAAFGWVGIRGMTWFLFGRYGTPAVLAVLSRESLTYGEGEPHVEPLPPPNVFRDAVAALKAEVEWFKKEARYLFELLTLPVLQLLAAAVNFAVVLVRSEPVFQLPFRDLEQVLATTPFVAQRAGKRRGASVSSIGGDPGGGTERGGKVAGGAA